MAEALSKEQARAQAWEMMLAKAREAQNADPKAVAAAKTLLADPAWKEAIEADVTAPQVSELSGKAAAGVAADGLPEGCAQVPWDVKFPGYIGGKLAFGVDFDEERTEREGTLVIEDIGWGSA
ncbi:MAG TPA: hypothetical protein VKS82_05140 [Streptosporangiaceae bacterium]|jgi:hypothetical protein|nr:hypothetical protein [Streptosporangiaceae bacterium]